jgi:hypothetical protein
LPFWGIYLNFGAKIPVAHRENSDNAPTKDHSPEIPTFSSLGAVISHFPAVTRLPGRRFFD